VFSWKTISIAARGGGELTFQVWKTKYGWHGFFARAIGGPVWTARGPTAPPILWSKTYWAKQTRDVDNGKNVSKEFPPPERRGGG